MRDFHQVASRSRAAQQGAEAPAGFDLLRGERLADHDPRIGLVLLYRQVLGSRYNYTDIP
ncbi:hypothetical protein GCM10009634_76640 [Saccharothrix xinjiangensis]